MKTAEELAEELILALDHSDLTQKDIETFLHIHLLDAWKQGMTDAAKIVRHSDQIDIINDRIFASDEILTARDDKAFL